MVTQIRENTDGRLVGLYARVIRAGGGLACLTDGVIGYTCHHQT